MALDKWTKAASGSTGVEQVRNSLTTYAELPDSQGFTVNGDDAFGQASYLVSWFAASAFVDDLVGYSAINPDNSIHRELPHEHVYFFNFYATSAELRPLGVASIDAVGDYVGDVARVNVTYRPLAFRVLPDNKIAGDETKRYVERMSMPVVEYLSLQGNMQFVSRTTNKAINSPQGKIISKREIRMRWVDVPAKNNDPFHLPNEAAVAALHGKVNEFPFDDYPAGTLLFKSVEPKLVKPKLQTGTYSWDITFVFDHMDNGVIAAFQENAGHNFIYDVINGRWDLITHSGANLNGNRIYEQGNFQTLFEIA